MEKKETFLIPQHNYVLSSLEKIYWNEYAAAVICGLAIFLYIGLYLGFTIFKNI